MKRLILMSALLLGMLTIINAQEANMNKDITAADYERLLESQLKVDFRTKAYESMGLTEKQIIAFDPLYNEYTDQKRELLHKKFDLIDDYKKEMAEDNTAKNEEEETSDFIKNYWRLEINEMELKKGFFDRFEDVVSNNQAVNFFLLEESMQNQMERPSLIRVVPMINEFDRMRMSNDKENMEMFKEERMKNSSKNEMQEKPKMESNHEWSDKKVANSETKTEKSGLTEKTATSTATSKNAVTTYSQWVKDAKGGVALNHQYTHDGLTHLVGAVWALAEANSIDISAWDAQKEKVMNIAGQLQVDPLSTDHADLTREAFIIIAGMIETIQTKANNTAAKAVSQSVVEAAHAIDPDKLLTKQAKKIYTFFEQADRAVNKIYPTTAAKSSSAYNQNK